MAKASGSHKQELVARSEWSNGGGKGKRGAGWVSGRTLGPPGNEGLQGPLEVSSHDQTLKVRGSPSPGCRESTGKFSESLHPGCTPVPIIQSGRDREADHDPSIKVSVKAPHVPPPHPKGSEALLLGPKSRAWMPAWSLPGSDSVNYLQQLCSVMIKCVLSPFPPQALQLCPNTLLHFLSLV